MAKNITFKVINARKVSFAVLAADIAVGYTGDSEEFVGLFVIPDFLLKKSPTKGYYYQGPSKPFMKEGVHQEDDKGYKRYLEFFRLYTEKGAGAEPEKYSPTKASWDARKHIIAILVEALAQVGGETEVVPVKRATQRTAPARSTRPVGKTTTIDEEAVGVPSEDADEDMPF